MEELLGIGEFSHRSGLSHKMLRSYGVRELLTPAVVDRESGYRYYTDSQIEQAKTIGQLRRAGIPLAEIAAYLSQPTGDHLDRWERRLEEEMAIRREALDEARRRHRAGRHPSSMPIRSRPRPREPMARLEAAVTTQHPGRVRSLQQDALCATDDLLAVADGFGPGGEQASRAALDALVTTWSAQTTTAGLYAAAEAANQAACAAAGDRAGTTLAAVAITEEGVTALHVGDSRVYHWHGDKLSRVTQDHTLVNALIKAGELPNAGSGTHWQRELLTRALGIDPTIDASLTAIDARAGDLLLVCTDGLWSEVDDPAIAEVLRQANDPTSATTALLAQALAGGAKDNLSIGLAKVA